MRIEDISRLTNNPIWASRILCYFLSGAASCGDGAIKFELIYLALPLVSDEKVLLKLASSSTRSTFTTVFKEVELKNRLVGIDDRIAAFVAITNKALIFIGSEIAIGDSGVIRISNVVHYSDASPDEKYYCKAAFNLGVILAKGDYKEIFLRIGVAA